MIIALGLGLVFVLSAAISTSESDKQQEWISLFNGQDLDDWVIKIKGHKAGVNHLNTFRVEEGILKVNYENYKNFDQTFGHIFYKTSFKDYRLKFNYRFTGEQVPGGPGWATRNSGVMVHSQDPYTMELDQDFPVSLEVQLLGGLKEGESRPTGNLCTPGTHVIMNGKLIKDHCIQSSSATYYGDQWVEAEVIVKNNKILTHLINGQEVISYVQPIIGGEFNSLESKEGQALSEGYIAFQSESHPVEFKDIKLLVLDE